MLQAGSGAVLRMYVLRSCSAIASAGEASEEGVGSAESRTEARDTGPTWDLWGVVGVSKGIRQRGSFVVCCELHPLPR